MHKILIALLASICLTSFAAQYKESDVKAIASQINDPKLLNLAQKTDKVIGLIISHAVETLHDQGFDRDAEEINMQYKSSYRGFVENMVSDTHHIGDHKPLLDWLAKTYATIESKLGVQTCKALHLSDLKTINFAIPVVFHPCDFNMDNLPVDRQSEYRRHFSKDDNSDALYGLVPVTTYWIIEGACLVGTSGLGSILCGIGASGAEWFMGNSIAPSLSDALFNKICG